MLDPHKNITQRLSDLKCCIIIPTYNNENTLKRVIDGVLHYTSDIIIVNDGATDSTPTILQDYTSIEQIHFKQNKGKGSALRVGFKKAEQLGYEYAITIDSDGQHYPDDIPVFITTLEQAENKNLLLIGSRNMTQEGVPKGNSFGNQFSNFWYRFETGVDLQDTQSGYRLYPLKSINEKKYFTTRFEFEIEVIVKAAWNGVTVQNVPIKVLYDASERVTHFRPYKDFARISVLNTYLVLIALLYIKPRDFFRTLKKKGFKRFLLENVFQHQDSPIKKSLSIALGVFIGIAPFWGFQTVLALGLATIFKLNKAIAFTFSNVSIPPFIPLIIFGSLKFGQLIMGGETIFFQDIGEDFDVGANILQYVVGSFALASIMAILSGGLGFILLRFFGSTEKRSSSPTLPAELLSSNDLHEKI